MNGPLSHRQQGLIHSNGRFLEVRKASLDADGRSLDAWKASSTQFGRLLLLSKTAYEETTLRTIVIVASYTPALVATMPNRFSKSSVA